MWRLPLLLVAGVLGTIAVAADVLTFVDATTEVTTQRPGLAHVGTVTVSPDGRNVYTTTAFDEILNGPALTVFRRDPDGSLHWMQVYSEPYTSEAFCSAGQALVAPDGSHVYLMVGCSDRIRIFARDAQDGGVTPIGDIVHVDLRADGLLDGSAMAISPDGLQLYAGLDLDRTMGVFRRDPATGGLTWQEGHTVARSAGAESVPGGIALSADGTSLYIADRDATGDEDALHVFRRDPATGALSLLQTLRDGTAPLVSLGDMSSVVVSPDGRHVYTGYRYDAEHLTTTFARDAATGRLTATHATALRGSGASMEAISPDGRLLLVTDRFELTVVRRDTIRGDLTIVESHVHADVGVDGLGFVDSGNLAISPDGRDVYTASYGEWAIGHFRRSCPDAVVEAGEACDDGNATDDDGCNALCQVEPCFTCTGSPSACTPIDGVSCDDGNACTATSTCAGGLCQPGEAIDDGTPCDDGDACTTADSCIGGACRGGMPPTCGMCETCDYRFGCVGVPRPACVHSAELGASGRLLLDADSSRLRLRWAGAKGGYPPSLLGDPTIDTDWTLCIFEAPDSAVRRRRRTVASFAIPAAGTCGARPCWRRRDGGFQYRDGHGRADGVRRITLVPTARTLSFLARGPGVVPPLPLALPVTVELRNAVGACWVQDWSRFVHRNDQFRFSGPGGVRSTCDFVECDGH